MNYMDKRPNRLPSIDASSGFNDDLLESIDDDYEGKTDILKTIKQSKRPSRTYLQHKNQSIGRESSLKDMKHFNGLPLPGGISDSLGKFFKADAFLKITKTKNDQNKISREIKYQFSPRYRSMVDTIKKPCLAEEPKTFAPN